MEDIDDDEYFNNTTIVFEDDNYIIDGETAPKDNYKYHPWGIFFTIIGTVLLDFDADACQSPSRAYLLDVTLPGQFDDIMYKVSMISRAFEDFHLFPLNLFLCWQ